MNSIKIAEAVEKAWEVRSHAYAPYSSFAVGSALIDSSGAIHIGCNVENASYGLTQCAERNAVAAAAAVGVRDIATCIIVTDTEEPTFPCGACRQVLSECNPHMNVISITRNGNRTEYLLNELLPKAFTL